MTNGQNFVKLPNLYRQAKHIEDSHIDEFDDFKWGIRQLLTKLVKFVKLPNLGKIAQEKGTREAVNSMNAAKWQIQ